MSWLSGSPRIKSSVRIPSQYRLICTAATDSGGITGVAFLGMLLQLPLVALTKFFERSESPTKRMIGNCIFWFTFSIFGQPFAALLYFYAWQNEYGSISDKWKYGRK